MGENKLSANDVARFYYYLNAVLSGNIYTLKSQLHSDIPLKLVNTERKFKICVTFTIFANEAATNRRSASGSAAADESTESKPKFPLDQSDINSFYASCKRPTPATLQPTGADGAATTNKDALELRK